MAQANHKTAIGAFTLGGILLFFVGLIFLGGGGIFKQKREYVLYFDGSVSGLNVGAPVVFRGVPLGSVTRISLVFDRQSSAITIPVFIKLDESSIVRLTGESIPEQYQDRIVQHMVKNGLSAQLQVQNLITGQFRIELDYHKETATTRSAAPNEIPTVPSPLNTLQKSLAGLPFKDLAKATNTIMLGLSTAIGDGTEIKQAIAGIRNAFTAMEKSFQNLNTILEHKVWRDRTDKILGHVEQSTATLAQELPAILTTLSQTMNTFAQTAERMKHTSAFAEQLLSNNSPVIQDVRRLLKECGEAARSLRNLADMLNRNPEALIHGKKGGR